MNTKQFPTLIATLLLIVVCPQLSQSQGIQKELSTSPKTPGITLNPEDGEPTGRPSLVKAPPFRASLLLVTADWSKVPAAKTIDKDLRDLLKEVKIPAEQMEKLPATGTDVLFAPEMIGFYTSEHYAQFHAWLMSHQLIQQTIPFTLPSISGVQESGAPPTYEMHLRQPSEFLGLPPLRQAQESPFVTRYPALTWDIHVGGSNVRTKEPQIILDHGIVIFEQARGQSAARVSSTLAGSSFSLPFSEPTVLILNAFPRQGEATFREAAHAKGFETLLVIDMVGQAIDPAATKPQLHLPDKVDTIRGGGSGLRWPEQTLGQKGQIASSAFGSASSSVDSDTNPELSVFSLQYTSASTTAEMLRQLFAGKSTVITADQRANTLVVKAPRDVLDQIKALVLRLDETPDQKTATSDTSNTRASLQTGRVSSAKQVADTIENLRRQYDLKEQRTRATAEQLRQLRTKGPPESREVSRLEQQLRQEVADAFAARQALHQAEVASLQQRIGEMQQTMSARSRIQDQIIDRRVQDLLNPNLAWDSNSTSSPGQDKYGEARTGGTNSTGSSRYGRSSTVTSPVSTVRGTPLSDAVRAFNVANENHPDGKDQPPLTDDDVVAAIRWSVSTSDRRKIPDADANILEAIAETRVLPDNAQLELGTRFDLPDGSKLTKWTISVTLHHADGTGYQHLIREQLVRWEPAPGVVENSPDSGSGLSRPKDTPLAAAIHGFNEKHSGDKIGKDQPPLTEDEVIAAIRWYKTKRNEADLTNEEFQAFQEIADKGMLPDKVEFEVLTGFQPNDRFRFDAWSVRIVMPRLSKKGWTYGFTIRDRWINSERLAERQISWGTVAPNGFQAGILIKPQSEQYAEGQQIVPLFVFRNTGKQTLEVAFPNLMSHGYYHALRVVDSAGRDIEVDQDPGPGGPVGWLQIDLAAGSEHVISGIPIALGNVSRESGVETVVKAKPGQSCRLRFTVPNFSERNSKPIETGEIRFTMGPKS